MSDLASLLEKVTPANCPFCGEGKFVRLQRYQFPPDDEGPAWKWGYHVICDASGIEGTHKGCGSSSAWGETAEEALAAWNRRLPPVAMITTLERELERERGDLRYAKQALDRETARALKFGARATAAEAKAARMGEALKPFSVAAGGVFTRNFNASDVLFRKPASASGAESVITAGHLFAARSALQSTPTSDRS